MHANHRQDVDKVYAGDIAAAVGLKDATTGDTLVIQIIQLYLNKWNSLEPVIESAIEPKDKANSEKWE